MKRIFGAAVCALFIVALITMATSTSTAGASNKKPPEQTQEQVEPGKLYFDPDKYGGHADDSAPYSDPYYGKDREAGGGGGQRGPKGVTEDKGEVKRIEGPVRYERVED